MPKKAAPAQAAPAPPRKLKAANLTIRLPKDDEDTLPLLRMLTDVWAAEGRIPEVSQGAAVRYMVHNFGEAARHPAANGALPLDPVRRRELATLREILEAGGDVPKGSKADIPVVNLALDLMFSTFTNRNNGSAYLEDYLKSRGKI